MRDPRLPLILGSSDSGALSKSSPTVRKDASVVRCLNCEPDGLVANLTRSSIRRNVVSDIVTKLSVRHLKAFLRHWLVATTTIKNKQQFPFFALQPVNQKIIVASKVSMLGQRILRGIPLMDVSDRVNAVAWSLVASPVFRQCADAQNPGRRLPASYSQWVNQCLWRLWPPRNPVPPTQVER